MIEKSYKFSNNELPTYREALGYLSHKPLLRENIPESAKLFYEQHKDAALFGKSVYPEQDRYKYYIESLEYGVRCLSIENGIDNFYIYKRPKKGTTLSLMKANAKWEPQGACLGKYIFISKRLKDCKHLLIKSAKKRNISLDDLIKYTDENSLITWLALKKDSFAIYFFSDR